MNPFDAGIPISTEARRVEVQVYTAAFLVSGVTATRFARVADILNQLSVSHLAVEQATVRQHGTPVDWPETARVLVPVSRILLMVAPESRGAARPDMLIVKRPFAVRLGLPPFVVSGQLHVPAGVGSVDGLLNAVEVFLVVTDAQISSVEHPDLDREAAAIAVQRASAEVVVLGDDEHPDQLLADILDAHTAAGWLRKPGDR